MSGVWVKSFIQTRVLLLSQCYAVCAFKVSRKRHMIVVLWPVDAQGVGFEADCFLEIKK